MYIPKVGDRILSFIKIALSVESWTFLALE